MPLMRKPQRFWLMDSDAVDPVYAVAPDAETAKKTVLAVYPTLTIHEVFDATENVNHENESSEESLWELRNDKETCVVFLHIHNSVLHQWERVQGKVPDVLPDASKR